MPYEEKKGVWRATTMVDGARFTKRFSSKAEAKKWEVQQKDRAKSPTPIVTDSLSVLEWLNTYLDHMQPKLAPKTYVEEKLAVFRRFIGFVGPDTRVGQLTSLAAMKYLDREAKNRTGCAANKDRKNLIAAWNWGIKHLRLPMQNPFVLTDKHPVDEKPKYIPSLAEANRVIAAANTEEDRVFLTALLHTAARRGEVCRLKWDDVDLEGGKIRLGTRKRKGGAMHYDWIFMSPELTHALAALKRSARGEFVFPRTDDGQPYKWRQHLMKRLCKRARVRYFGFHALRHLTASLMAAKGVAMPEIQFVLRHRAMTTTNGYIQRLGYTKNPLEGLFEGEEPTARETAVAG